MVQATFAIQDARRIVVDILQPTGFSAASVELLVEAVPNTTSGSCGNVCPIQTQRCIVDQGFRPEADAEDKTKGQIEKGHSTP